MGYWDPCNLLLGELGPIEFCQFVPFLRPPVKQQHIISTIYQCSRYFNEASEELCSTGHGANTWERHARARIALIIMFERKTSQLSTKQKSRNANIFVCTQVSLNLDQPVEEPLRLTVSTRHQRMRLSHVRSNRGRY